MELNNNTVNTKNREIFITMAHAMDDRFVELDMYRQEVENLLQKANHSVGTSFEEHLELRGGVLYAESFPNILHATVWVVTVALLEKELSYVARALRDVFGLPLSFNDIYGTWAERFKKYVVDLAHIPLKIAEESWADLAGIIEVRNCFMHNLGDLENYPKRKTIEGFCRCCCNELQIRENALYL